MSVNSSNRRERRGKPRVNRFLDVTQVSLARGVLSLGVAGGAILQCRCGSRPPAIRPGRLAYSQATYRSHEEQVRDLTRKQRCPHDTPELASFLAPAVAHWAAGKTGLDVVELGPAHTIDVPNALKFATASYTGVDFSPPFIKKQRELLLEDPFWVARARHIVADTYELSLPDASCDLVACSCHPPFVSASIRDKVFVLDKVHAFMRPGAMFALFPWFFEEQPEEVTKHLLKRFVLRHIAFRDSWTDRLLLFLEKR